MSHPQPVADRVEIEALRGEPDVSDPSGCRRESSKGLCSSTMDRLESLLRAKGIKVFARIDQNAEAQVFSDFRGPESGNASRWHIERVRQREGSLESRGQPAAALPSPLVR